jgi:prepilin-type processing-associated H-X9-DG protein
MGLGVLQYAQDYDEKTPVKPESGFGTAYQCTAPDTGTWGNQIMPYVKSTQIFKCPSAGPYNDATYFNGNTQNFSSSYLMNAMITTGASPTLATAGQVRYTPNAAAAYDAAGFNTSLIEAPAVTISIVEGTSDYDNGPGGGPKVTSAGARYYGSYLTAQQNNDGTPGLTGTSYGMPGAYFSKIHLEGMNLAFCDGHVKWFSFAKLKTLGNGTIPFAGYKNGSPGGAGLYQNNGIADFQPLVTTAAGG